MIAETDLKEIKPKLSTAAPSSAHVQSGIHVPKPIRVKNFSPDEWEDFTEEWAASLESVYVKVRRFGGSGDCGVDVAISNSSIGEYTPPRNHFVASLGVGTALEKLLNKPISLKKIHYEPFKGRVLFHTKYSQYFKQNLHMFDALDFLADLTQHITPKGLQLIRRYGLYASRTKGRWQDMLWAIHGHTAAEIIVSRGQCR